ncbi:VOC family protein [Paenibacillus sp. GCM10027628]|uniref:VOC family protein n=1 Tax=Paenibacillus sp. GCM10027628 TaxID=3273413 RepID=UPI003632A49F
MSRQISSSLTAFMVSDLERSKQFYREVLGFDVTDWWAVRDGLQGLALKLLQAPTPQDVKPNPPENEGARAFDVYAYTDDWTSLDSLYEEFRNKGAVISGEPVVMPDFGPWKEFIVQDPDGYHIAFGGVDGRKANSFVQDHVDSVFLWVRNLDKSVKLYAALLGLEIREQDRYGHLHMFNLSNGTGLILDSNGMSEIPVPEVGPVLFKMSTVDIEGAHRHALELGFQVIYGIARYPQVSFFNIRDDDGNIITISQNHT